MSMRNSQWSDAGVKRLDFGGSGQAGRMEWVFGGALIVIIIGVCIMLYISMSGPSTKVDPNPMVHLQCVNPQCGERLSKKYLDFSEEDRLKIHATSLPPMPGAGGPPRIRCEKCQAVMGRMDKCPQCEQYYLDPMEINRASMQRICPNPECGIDINKYWQQKALEQKKK